MSKSSRTSLRSYGKYGTRKKADERKNILKPYDFCCDINNRDDETRYDKRKPPFTSSLTVLSPIQESPLLKFRFETIEPVVNGKKKSIRNKSKPEDWTLEGNPCVQTRGPILWYQEDELELAKRQFWSDKQKIYNEKADRNALIGEKKVKNILASSINSAGPRWYQDLSIPQMKHVLELGESITADYEETITTRTQKALAVIGVTSTFFKISPQLIKKLQRSTKLQPVQFLREIYKKFTGKDFEEEDYKKTYECNERIILSAIAFLALPETVIELNNRLPQISKPAFPPKPKPPQPSTIHHGLYKSPYTEPLFEPPDWAAYRTELDKWHENCKLIPWPRAILPKVKLNKVDDSRSQFEESKTGELGGKAIVTMQSKMNNSEFDNLRNEELRLETGNNVEDSEDPLNFSISTSPGGAKQTFDFTISGLGERSGPVNYKICGTLKPPSSTRKSWLGEKEAHYIISGISENEDPPKYPVTYVMTGISYVTPNNSDEKFLAELKLGDNPKRVYPSGRKNLSKNWQEWLLDADEEFLEVEKEANKLIKSVEATMRLVIPGDRCDACCSCRQTRKTNLKEHETKTPYMVIESIAEGDNRNRYIVGSMAMHSPAPSPAESTVNLLEVVASKEMIQKKLVINGVTNDDGETTYYISGVTEEVQHTPKTTVFKQRPPKPLRNVPPCACNIEKIFNEGKPAASASTDDIPQTKKKGICCGRKYRPTEAPAFSCKDYPEDKCCRRNPFDNKLKRGSIFQKSDRDRLSSDEPEEKKMFTLPAFAPCGDEKGMAICGGPWGTTNIIDTRAVAEASERVIQIPKVRKLDEEEDEDEEEEEELGERGEKLSPRDLAKKAKEIEAQEREVKRKQLKRDDLCSERIEDAITDANESGTTKESVNCEAENQWDRMRTAPTINPWNNEYEKSLRLTNPSGEHNKTEFVSKKRRKKNSAEKENIKNGNQKISNSATKDNVQVIYNAKQAARDQPSSFNSNVTRSPESDGESEALANKDRVKQISSGNKNKFKNSANDTEKSAGELIKSNSTNKKSNNKSKQNKTSKKNDNSNNRDERSSKSVKQKKVKPKESPKGVVEEYKVAPAVIFEESRLPCQREKTYFDNELDNCECTNELDVSNDAVDRKEGPFGWRTKSQQELPREKTLVYLAERNDPVEMVKLREGGRPCNCRENRNKKKVLIYNLGGAVADVTKGKRKCKLPQLIEGVTYVTPPQSPRNSSEYIPEYDILESPYKKCGRKKLDKDLHSADAESCPCGYEHDEDMSEKSSPKEYDESKNTASTKGTSWSSALKDEGLIDHFVSCQDEVPCWLKCARFSKAGCCEKRKLLQVKKPVCECRYERRVVKREEEKKKWVDRQQRLRSAKKQAYLQVSGTSRPMTQDTKLMISSVKKVLRDGEFLPETQYCVTGIAENYAMGPPRHIVPGITMQSPIVTPEPSKPDILCMCGHRHWSPMDITAGQKEPVDVTVRGKGEYPCRGREQEKTNSGKIIPGNGETITAGDDGADVAYRGCADAGRNCSRGVNENVGDLTSRNKRKLVSNGVNLAQNTKRRFKNVNSNSGKVPQDPAGKKTNGYTDTGTGKKPSEQRNTRIEESKGSEKEQRQNSSPQSETPENRDTRDNSLVGLMKIELEKMAHEDFILTKLPECWLMPQLQSWIEYREGNVYTDSMKKKLCQYSSKRWEMMQDIKKPSIPLPSLNLTHADIATMTFDRASEMKAKISIAQAKYFSKLRKSRVSEASLYWPTMEFGRFPNLSFKQAYFTYMAAKEADGHVFRPWKTGDSK